MRVDGTAVADGESIAVRTLGGVEEVDQPAGEVIVTGRAGVVELLVNDDAQHGQGDVVTVELNYDQAVQLVLAVGALAELAGQGYGYPRSFEVAASGGEAVVVSFEGGTVVELLVDDGEGANAVVWLDYSLAAALVLAVCAVAVGR
jgi:hypothetical protein